MTANAKATQNPQSGAHHDLVSFIRLLTGTRMVADRCHEYVIAGGPARETFDYVMDRFACIRGRFRDLSPIEQSAVWMDVEALGEEVLALRRLLARRDRECLPLVFVDPPRLPSSRPPRSSSSCSPEAA